MFTLNLKRNLAVVMITLSIFISTSFPLPTKAVATEDPMQWKIDMAGWAERAGNWAVDNGRWLADNALKVAMARVLRQMTDAIVKWIDTGFKGNPAFITNTDQFIRDTADATIGDMLLGTDLKFLCDPFKIQVKLALGLQYRPFQNQIACSFTSALGNVNDAMNKFTNGDFIGGGGWNSWLQMTTVPQNNQMGAMMIAQSELDARIETSTFNKIKQADWGNGFMSWEECVNVPQPGDTDFNGPLSPDQKAIRDNFVGPPNPPKQQCTIQTPGSTIANKLNWADSSDIRKTELANDVNAIANALLNQLISNLTKGLLKMGSGSPKRDTTAQDNAAYLNSLQAQLMATQANQNNINSNNSNSASGSYNSNGTINFSQTFANRAIALDTINSQLAIEKQYLTAQNNIYQLLDAAQNAFNSSTCDSSVKTTVTNQITGDYTGVKDLVWNKKDVTTDSAVTTSNISTLNFVSSAVQNVTNDASVPGIVQPLTTMSTLHSASSVSAYSTGGNTYNQIKNWVVNQINSYGTSCNINKSGLSTWGIQ